MKIFGLILLALGAYLAYSGYKRKFIKTKEGQSLGELNKELLGSDVNDAVKRGMGVGCNMYLKMMGLIGGIVLMLIGLLLLLF